MRLFTTVTLYQNMIGYTEFIRNKMQNKKESRREKRMYIIWAYNTDITNSNRYYSLNQMSEANNRKLRHYITGCFLSATEFVVSKLQLQFKCKYGFKIL